MKKSIWIVWLAAIFVCGCPSQINNQSGGDGQSPASKPAPASYQQELLKQIDELKAEKKIAEERLEAIRIRDNLITGEYNKLKLTVQQHEQTIKLLGGAINERDVLKNENQMLRNELLQLQKENKRLRDVISGLGPASAPGGGK
ncbi:MAG: hypothetical protein HZA50_13145 [Planctomycetes bacterium]|nr:hypothetical protein [Planctomycetota bacterium]